MEKEGKTKREKGDRQTIGMLSCLLHFGHGFCDGSWNDGYLGVLDLQNRFGKWLNKIVQSVLG